jgi:hypothetical protein
MTDAARLARLPGLLADETRAAFCLALLDAAHGVEVPGQNPETAFCAGVRWSLVISVTDGRESTRSPW